MINVDICKHIYLIKKAKNGIGEISAAPFLIILEQISLKGKKKKKERYTEMKTKIPSFMIDPLSSYTNQCSTTGVTKLWYVLSCLWDGAYKTSLAANKRSLANSLLLIYSLV